MLCNSYSVCDGSNRICEAPGNSTVQRDPTESKYSINRHTVYTERDEPVIL
jgi:hypothetical protein